MIEALLTCGGETIPSFEFTISENMEEITLDAYAASLGWDGVSPVKATVESGVYIWTDSTDSYGMETGLFPNGLTLIVDGYIIGKGGAGASSTRSSDTGSSGYSGGPALVVNCPTTIIGGSEAFIAGGGGGGARGLTGIYAKGGFTFETSGGGGAGGGDGGSSYRGPIPAGGLPGQAGENGTVHTASNEYKLDDATSQGGGGGRILPGNGGTGSLSNIGAGKGGGAGGGGARRSYAELIESIKIAEYPGPLSGGNNGGSGGMPGESITNGFVVSAGGGGWGAKGGDVSYTREITTDDTTETLTEFFSGGAGGAAIEARIPVGSATTTLIRNGHAETGSGADNGVAQVWRIVPDLQLIKEGWFVRRVDTLPDGTISKKVWIELTDVGDNPIEALVNAVNTDIFGVEVDGSGLTLTQKSKNNPPPVIGITLMFSRPASENNILTLRGSFSSEFSTRVLGRLE